MLLLVYDIVYLSLVHYLSADSFVETITREKLGMRRRARGQPSVITQPVSTYCVRLREGQPPKEYYAKDPPGNVKLEEYIREQRKRRIIHSL
jgi:large subunit ribosomal protein L22